jgi:hypothetical protein
MFHVKLEQMFDCLSPGSRDPSEHQFDYRLLLVKIAIATIPMISRIPSAWVSSTFT